MPERYWPFDQDIKLGPRPWNPVDVRDWEEAHGHDIRMKCYPEFDCRVVEASYEHRLKTLRQGLAHRMGENERLKGAFDEIAALMGKSNDLLVRRKREMERERDQARAVIERVRTALDEMHDGECAARSGTPCDCAVATIRRILDTTDQEARDV